MADASRTPLGAAWIEVHGRGRLQPEHREELRSVLCRELEARAPQEAAPAIKDELDRFLENGRVTDTNLSRLERRVVRRAVGNGSMSARDDAGSIASGYTHSGCLSARPAAASAPPSEHLTSLHEEHPVGVDIEALSRWSEVAKYSRILEEREKVQKVQQRRQAQERLRTELQRQLDEKEKVKVAEKVWDKKLFEQQEDELSRWKDAQKAKEAEALRKMLRVKKEREEQKHQNEERREKEIETKLAEDRKAVKRAQAELDKEKQVLIEKKLAQKERQMKLAFEWREDKKKTENSKELQYEEERKKILEYHKMLEQQEARNKQSLPQPRGGETVKGGLPSGRRGDDVYTEEFLLRQQREANSLAEEAEKQKQQRLKTERETNQDFLFQQMQERKKAKEQAKETKEMQKQTVQAATSEYLTQERRSAEEARMKNIRYRIELQKQIDAKKAAEKSKASEDEMSLAERSMNRQIIEEAGRMRAKLQ